MKHTQKNDYLRSPSERTFDNHVQHLTYSIINVWALWQKYSIEQIFQVNVAEQLIEALLKVTESSSKLNQSDISELALKPKNLIQQVLANQSPPSKREKQNISNMIHDLCQPNLLDKYNLGFNLEKERFHKKSNHLIYLVDDYEWVTEKLSIELKIAGFNVLTFNNLNNFHSACKRTMPSIVIMDMVLREGEKAGANAVKQVQDYSNKDFSTIFISAHNDVESRLAAVRSGGSHYFVKPIDIEKLFNRSEERRVGKECR